MKVLTPINLWTINTLFPRNCVGCGVNDASLCQSCKQEIIRLNKQHCAHCTKITSLGVTCTNCRNKTNLNQLVSAAHYTDGPLKEALHTLKYHGRLDLAEPLSALITSQSDIYITLNKIAPDIITAVPQHRTRQWRRGFNQSAVIARLIARHYHRPYSDRLLIKIKPTSTQASLDKKARQDNLHNAFQTISTVANQTIVLIDDITTTGSTLNECARVLRAAGAKRIIGITVARTD